MTDNEPENPLKRPYVEDDSEFPETVAIDDVTIDAQEFLDRLESLDDAAKAVTTLAHDLEQLRETRLSDDDARDLIYGRNSSLTKRDIEAMFDAVDDLSSGRADRPLVRLLADVSGLNLAEVEEMIDELDRLHERYGDDDDR